MTGIGKLIAEPASTDQQAKLRKQVAEFEGLLLSQMLTKLKEAYHIPGEEQGDSSGESFQSFADSALGNCLAVKGGLGVTEMLMRSLTSNQGGKASIKMPAAAADDTGRPAEKIKVLS